ncbi:MAG: hypothetical protein WAT81_02320 [Candidatus Moraniibacteriota bacterium]
MTKTARPVFELTDELRAYVGEYFGRRIVAESTLPDTHHTTVRALLGEQVTPSVSP